MNCENKITTWTTKNNQVIKIKDMNSIHIQKCISLLKNNLRKHLLMKELSEALLSLIPPNEKNSLMSFEKFEKRAKKTKHNILDKINALTAELKNRGEEYNNFVSH